MIKIETKFDEITENTSDLNRIKGNYLAENLLRTWKEDFVDEDTSEVVSIERNEIILERGTFITSDVLSKINFYLQSGDIKDVSVSNQKRECVLTKNTASVWVVSIELNSKKKNIYLYANSIESAKDITVDFIEQKYSGVFKITSIKELDYSNLISVNAINKEDQDKGDNYYKIEVEICFDDNEKTTQNFILNASDAEKAKLLIINFLTKNKESTDEERNFQVTIISAKTIPCNDVVNHLFSKKHLDNYKD